MGMAWYACLVVTLLAAVVAVVVTCSPDRLVDKWTVELWRKLKIRLWLDSE